ncbi:MAG: oxidoreductase [Clostridiales Family XIII bacterium]|jgi:nitrogenase molybdenum-iron protein alpha chain|nr:oxidoreductase [Clostridiales Family XIII bacterium]
MAIDLNQKESETREQRLGSITGYDGRLSDLTEKGCSGCLQNKGRRFQTVSSCSHTHTINQLAGLSGALVVDHAPIGCSGGQVFFTLNRNRLPMAPPGFPSLEHAKVVSTDIDESDTIFGAAGKLRETVRAAYGRHRPHEIFIVSSCVSAVIGEDIFSVAQELTEELGIQVIAAAAEGLRSKIWATGFDSYSHAISKARLSYTGGRKPIVNYSGFGPVGRQFVEPFFERLGLELNLLVAGATPEDFAKATQAIASWGQCSSQSNYLLSVLEQEYGVHYFQSHLPYGGIGFERFFRDLGKFVGKDGIVEEIIAEEKEKYREPIEKIKARLKGKRAFIALGSGFSYEYSRLLWELGVDVVHAVGYHFDPVLDQNNLESEIAAATDVKELKLDLDTSINDGQEMETYLLVKKYNPDFLLSRGHEASAWAMLQGIPALDSEIGFVIMGYRGLVEFGTTIVETLDSKNFVAKLGARYKSPFTDTYEGLSPFSFYEEDAAI